MIKNYVGFSLKNYPTWAIMGYISAMTNGPWYIVRGYLSLTLKSRYLMPDSSWSLTFQD